VCPSLALENPNDYRVCNPITPLGCPGVGCFTVVFFFIFRAGGGVGAEGPAFGGAGYNPKRKGEIREDGYLMRCIHHGVVSNVTLRRVLLKGAYEKTERQKDKALKQRERGRERKRKEKRKKKREKERKRRTEKEREKEVEKETQRSKPNNEQIEERCKIEQR
jgi:hypothetical protein